MMVWRAILMLLLGAGGLARAAELPALPNGSMDEGGAAPAGWALTRPKEGSVAELTRDTGQFVHGPASLCLSVTGEVGQATCELPDAAGRRFVVRGFIKSTGKAGGLTSYQLAVHAQDAGWKQALWKDVWLENFLIRGRTPTEWTPFAGEVSVPAAGGTRAADPAGEGDGQGLARRAADRPAGHAPSPRCRSRRRPTARSPAPATDRRTPPSRASVPWRPTSCA